MPLSNWRFFILEQNKVSYIISSEPPSGDQGIEPPYRVQKVSDEGSSSPFIARIFMSMHEYQDLFLSANLQGRELFEAREKFDKKFRPMYEAAQAARDGG